MVLEFEMLLEGDEPDLAEPEGFAPEETGTFAKVDRYASRRGANHWTRRRPTQGPTRKLEDHEARAIRIAYFVDHTRVVAISGAYNVTASTCYGILRGKTHRRESAGWPQYQASEVREDEA